MCNVHFRRGDEPVKKLGLAAPLQIWNCLSSAPQADEDVMISDDDSQSEDMSESQSQDITPP